MYRLTLYFFFSGACFLLTAYCAAQKHDTLQTVEVRAKKQLSITGSPVPIQILKGEEISRRNSLTIADALRYFAGVTVKDYGGIGGLKTVSVRSLGASHTGVMYDGIVMADAQGGQTDLGKFSIENIEEIQLYNAGPTDILLPARAFYSASLVVLKSARVKKDEMTSFTLGVKNGSFEYISPSFNLKTRINRRFSTVLNGFYHYAKGNYPYASYENDGETIRRKSTNIKVFKQEGDATYLFSDSNKLRLKIYSYRSERILPGAIILYNPTGNQFLSDRNFFIQTTWENHITSKNSLLFSSKFSKEITNYTDPTYPNSYGRLENNFHQRELYFSAVYKYRFNDAIALSYASDVFNNKLNRTDIFADGFANPSRNSFLNNAAFQLKKRKFELNANLLYTVINEKVLTGKKGRNLQKFTPAIAASVLPFEHLPIRLRAFYKRIFRAPTFNELYFTNFGNTELRPEIADQYNAGITLAMKPFLFLENCTITGDAYLNKVTDKILAVPKQNLFQWFAQNIGKLNAKGTDVALHLRFREACHLKTSTNFSYSYQDAIDVSDKNSLLYKTQLPYTPRHSGSINLNAAYKKTVFSYNVLLSSYRFRNGEPNYVNFLPGWSSTDVTLSRLFESGAAEYRITAEANNIFNKQYEIVKYFPMPRFQYRIGIAVTLKKT